jgi:hypothetical protein
VGGLSLCHAAPPCAQVFGNFGGEEGFELVDTYMEKPTAEEIRWRIFEVVEERMKRGRGRQGSMRR